MIVPDAQVRTACLDTPSNDLRAYVAAVRVSELRTHAEHRSSTANHRTDRGDVSLAKLA